MAKETYAYGKRDLIVEAAGFIGVQFLVNVVYSVDEIGLVIKGCQH
jgi:hypothetical protein